MSIKWLTPAGSLGTITERIPIEIPLSAASTDGVVTLELIAGSLPRGLRLDNSTIKGSPVEVRVFTTNKFVVRANDGINIQDRTFSISVDGSDSPEWITREGFLNVGQGENYFVLDNAWVDFQLEATDTDLTAGDTLEYFLAPMGGQLPPGLTLSNSGRISGFTDPIFAIDYQNQTGAFDTTGYDIAPLDAFNTNSNGFDSFFYDTLTFDYNEPSIVPRRLSRAYSFIVWVSDLLNDPVERLFSIWVVTEEFLKSDNNIVQVDTNLFRSDNDGSRIPYWITESNLGVFRANNYVTIYLDVYDPPSLPGTIAYFLLPTNAGAYQLNNSNQITQSRYEISGVLPFFNYTLTGSWNAQKKYIASDAVTLSNQNQLYSSVDTWVCLKENTNIEPNEGEFWTNKGLNTNTQTFTPNVLQWTTVVPETVSLIPPGLELDTITGELAGRVPYQSAITKSYQFTMQAVSFQANLANINYVLVGDWSSLTTYKENQAVRYKGFIFIALYENTGIIPTEESGIWKPGETTSEKLFTVDVIGEIESNIVWISDANVGTIKPNQASELFVKAETSNYGGKVIYELVSGNLPPGLTLISTGEIQGKPKQFSDANGKGLTRFFDSTAPIENRFDISFDQKTTSFDQEFKFGIKARDTANFAESIKEFHIKVLSETTNTFANLYIKAFPSKQKRLDWGSFISDFDIFRPTEIYRNGDLNFGIQKEIKILLYAGIESADAVKFIQAMSRNHYRKQLRFGEVKSAIAKDPVTQQVVYEVVYVEIVDDYEVRNTSISQTVQLRDNSKSKVLISYDTLSVDSNIPFVSDSDHQRVFPNSIRNMRSRIKPVGLRDREFLPLWMRSIQVGTSVEPGFVKALVLCYVLSGASEKTISRIKASDFDFKSIDFTVDRYVIDIVNNQIQDQYLAFPQRDILNKLSNSSVAISALPPAIAPTVRVTFDSSSAIFDSTSLTFDSEFLIEDPINTFDNNSAKFDSVTLTFNQGQ